MPATQLLDAFSRDSRNILRHRSTVRGPRVGNARRRHRQQPGGRGRIRDERFSLRTSLVASHERRLDDKVEVIVAALDEGMRLARLDQQQVASL